jgi:uncharacterized BrkB/YihY/UPF0761 family membrane protein
MTTLALVLGWILASFMGLLALIILWKIVKGKIDLSKLISEKDVKAASLSRFQFLIFTFVIAMSLFIVVMGDSPPRFPETIPPEVLALLGISGASYVVSKSVQNSKKSKEDDQNQAKEETEKKNEK